MSSKEQLYGWAQSGHLVTGGGVRRGGANAVRMQAKLAKPDSLTTQFNLESDAIPPNCRAEIVSSVNGNSVRRLITVVDGAAITTRGNVVSVTARDFTASGISSGAEYAVSILSTLGVRANFKQPPILLPLEYEAIAPVPAALTAIVAAIPVPAATGEVDVPVPQDAGVISVMVTMISPASLIDNGDFTANQLVGAVVFQSYDPRDYDWVPVYPGTTSIRLINNGAADASAMVIFGIDG